MAIKTKAERTEALKAAMENKDTDEMVSAVNDLITQEGEELYARMLKQEDGRVLEARGMRQLTSEERKYYQAVIDAQRNTPSGSITNIDVVMPETVIDNVFDDIEQKHALLSHIDMMRVNAKIKILYTSADTNEAIWGKLTDKITQEIAYGFEELDAGLLKLSCFIPVPNAYLDLGPVYLDRLTRTYLYEAMAKGIEKAVTTNLSSATGPICMIADMTKGTTNSGVTTYTKKSAVKVTDWTPKGLANVLKMLAKTRKGNPRPVIGAGLFLAVNSADNYSIVKPAMMVQNASGEWVSRSPYPVTVVESEFIPAGEAILGMDNRYILGMGSDKNGTIETSKDYQFLEDATVYKCKLYGNGQPKDNNSFVRLDISELKEAQLLTTVVNNTVTTPAQGS